jgi:tripartite-type tricarboxylate transporter receptor subunit TctC
MAPAGTPPDIIKRLHAAAVTMVQTPAVRERFAAMNVHPVGNTPEQFAQIVVSDTARWAQYVKTLNFKAE